MLHATGGRDGGEEDDTISRILETVQRMKRYQVY
jgi:hypothetical protein